MKKLTEIANEEYYSTGEPILRDQEYDLLADHGMEIKNFRNKAKHYQPMGSLNKIKTREEYEKWLPKGAKVRVTPKLDGNSIELIIDASGEIVQAITRGDGYEGSDITDKIHYCNIGDLPENIKCLPFCSIPCEAIIPKKFQKDYEKNIRNVAAGILGREQVVRDELIKIDVIPFSSLPTVDYTSYDELEKFFQYLKNGYDYEIDGLVVELVDKPYNETDPLLPANKAALKFNKEGVNARVGSIEWNLGKHGRLTPVIILETPVEIDFTTVSRVSASNYGIVKAAGLGICAEIKVIKSGDIIPYITEVLNPSDAIPTVFCPNCSTMGTVSANGVHMECIPCKEDGLTLLQHCFGVFDLEFVSKSTIETLYSYGYMTLEHIFMISESELVKMDGIGKSKARNILSKMKNITLTEAQVLECAMVQGLGNKQCQKLIDYFGTIQDFLDNEINTQNNIILIDGFGDVLSQTVIDNMPKFRKMYNVLSRYCKIKTKELTMASNGYNIVCTGKCDMYGRKELTKKLEEMGHTVDSSVTKNTTLLLTDDPNSNSGKTKKAKDLGIEIKTYEEFLG